MAKIICTVCPARAEFVFEGTYYCEDHAALAPGYPVELEDCWECGGIGSALVEVDFPEDGHRTESYDKCEACKGAGKVVA